MWLLLPFALTVAASRLLWPCYLHPCLICAAPAATLLLALGIRSLGGRLGTITLLIVCVLAFHGLRRFYREPLKEQWRRVVRHIVKERREGDAVLICSGGCLVTFDYYCRIPKEALPRYPISRDLGVHELRTELPRRLAAS